MNYREFARKQTESVRRTVGEGTAVSALSGGVARLQARR
jgi:GMP synthase PP-ATPase subunit